jgi:Tfp pilus assembly protein PilO
MTAALKFNLTARSLAAALLGVVVVIAAGGWLMVVSPKRSQVSKLDSTLQAKQTQLATAQHEQQTLTGSRPGDSRLAGKALPDQLAMPQIVDQLNALGARSGVSLDTVTPSPAVVGVGYEAVPLSIVVDGHYFAVEQFLRLMRAQVQIGNKGKLHASGRLFDVQSVQLQQTEPAPMVTATITVRAFYYAKTVAPAPVVAPATDTTTSSGS